ncbi:MAG: thiamine phosphate synthase [Bacteroidetes bacterium]|nr:thiamine phosphate synthase [Bacteroidota bacterium]
MIQRFQYLTQDVDEITHQELAEIACKNGIRWVQLRVKNKPFDEYLSIAKDVKKICDKFQATLIINDNVEICKRINADGVHLGKQDMQIVEARKILGENKIIGGTTNAENDILELVEQGVDYVGLGPFKFTKTKNNLSPTLGIDGYKNILQSINNQTNIPIIAIGGININDVNNLLETGIYGIAVSSAINLSNNKEKTIAQFLNCFS